MMKINQIVVIGLLLAGASAVVVHQSMSDPLADRATQALAIASASPDPACREFRVDVAEKVTSAARLHMGFMEPAAAWTQGVNDVVRRASNEYVRSNIHMAIAFAAVELGLATLPSSLAETMASSSTTSCDLFAVDGRMTS